MYANLGDAIKDAMTRQGMIEETLPGKYMYRSEVVAAIVDAMMRNRDGKHLGYLRGERMVATASRQLDAIDAEIAARYPDALPTLHSVAYAVYASCLRGEVAGCMPIERGDMWQEELRLAQRDAWQHGRTKRHEVYVHG